MVLSRLKGFVDSGQRAQRAAWSPFWRGRHDDFARAPWGRHPAPAAPAAAALPKRSDLGTVRALARANGLMVSERGRVQAALLATYDAANRESDEATASALEFAPVAEPESAPPAPTRNRTPRKAKAAVS